MKKCSLIKVINWILGKIPIIMYIVKLIMQALEGLSLDPSWKNLESTILFFANQKKPIRPRWVPFDEDEEESLPQLVILIKGDLGLTERGCPLITSRP